jgi:homoaconitate hydratase
MPCVIAASFSETYKRNAFNNGFVVFECPALVAHLRATIAKSDTKTVIAGDIEIDYTNSRLTFSGKSFPFPALSPVAQELVIAGGAEAVIAARVKATPS